MRKCNDSLMNRLAKWLDSFRATSGRRRPRSSFEWTRGSAQIECLDARIVLSVSILNASLADPSSGQSPMVFTLARTGDLQPPLGVTYQTADGTAKAGIDYIAQSGTAWFKAGSATTTISVPVLSNPSSTSNKTFSVNLISIVNNPPSFLPSTNFTVDTGPTSIATADFNQDGKLDLVVGDVSSANFSVMLNTTTAKSTTATFAAPNELPVSRAQGVAVGDFNGDGKPDIATVAAYSTNASVLLNTTATGANSATFLSPLTFPAGGGSPYDVKVADVNHDGKPDIITITNTINVLINTTPKGATTATFTAVQSFPAPQNPRSLTVADFNGDGKPDIAASGDYGQTAVVLLNTTTTASVTVTFAPQLNLPVGNLDHSIYAADVNGDKKPDLIVSSYNDLTVTVFPNTTATGATSAAFGAPVVLKTEKRPSGVIVNDVNLDGRPDLIVTNQSDGGNFVTVFANTTSSGKVTPSFAPGVDFQTALAPVALVAGDFNTDSRPDLAVVNNAGNNVSILLNNLQAISQKVGTGTIVAHPSHTPVGTAHTVATLANKAYRFVASDFGFTDPNDTPPNAFIAVKITSLPGRGTLTDNGVPVLSGQFVSVADINSGKLLFAPVAYTDATNYASFRFQVQDSGTSANLDPSSKKMTINVAARVFPHVVSINGSNSGGLTTAGGTLSYTVTFSKSVTGVDASDFKLVTTGSTKVTGASPIVVTPVSGSVYTVKISNVTGAGSITLDLVDNGTIRDLQGNPLTSSKSSVAYKNQVTLAAGQLPYEVVAADLNRDGKLDLVAVNFGSNSVSVLLGNGNGTFKNQVQYKVGSTPWALSVADVNGDGKADIITTNSLDNSVSVLLGNGDGTFKNQMTFAVGQNPRGTPAVADVNGDGKPDLITANSNDNTVSVLLGNGNGTFKNQVTYNVGSHPRQVAVVDVNNDGFPDIIAANAYGMSVSVLMGNGNGTFQAQKQFTAGSSLGNTKFLSVADLNGDNKPDIVVTDGNAGTVSVLLGNGNGTFQKQVTYATGQTPQAVNIFDVNGDGIKDIVVTNWGASSNSVGVLLGNGNGTFQKQVTFATGLAPHSVVFADVNGDGRPDMIVADEYSNSISILLSAMIGNFTGQTYKVT